MKPVRFLTAPILVGLLLCFPVRVHEVSAVGSPIEGGGTVNRIAKFTGTQCIGNSVIREDGSGNVGIGGTNPAIRFLVTGGRFAVNANSGGSLGALIANQNGLGPIATFSTSSGADLKMILDNAGNLGIGTDAPEARIHVNSTGTGAIRVQRNGEVQYQMRAFGGGAFPLYSATRGRGLDTAIMPVQEGDLLLGINGNGYFTSTGFATGASIQIEANEDWDTSNLGGRIVLSGRNDGTTFLTEWMRVVNGDVGIGSTAPSEKLHVAGNICATGTIGTCSDRRFKKDIEPLEAPLETVRKLQAVRYSWNDRFHEVTGDDTADRQIGLIAQEVEEVLPEVVSTGRNGYRSVDYGKLTAVLIEALKEQQAQIDELRAELRDLKGSGDG